MAARKGIAVVEPEIRVFAPETMTDEAATVVVELIEAAVDARGSCRLGLAGGGTPRPIYERLAQPPFDERVPWHDTHWFWGDERAVPPDDDASNYALVQRALLSKVDVPPENVHRMRGEVDPERAAQEYADLLPEERLDVLLLGMGGDGHTASLFPGTAAAGNEVRRVVVGTAPVPPHARISLGWRAINEARVVALLVVGAAKAERLAQVRAQQLAGAPVLPAARIQPTKGRLIWLLDTAAAEKLETSK